MTDSVDPQNEIRFIRFIQREGAFAKALLWEEPMRYSGLFKAGDEVIQDGAWYKVTHVEVQDEFQIVTLDPIPAEPDVDPMRAFKSLAGPSLFPE